MGIRPGVRVEAVNRPQKHSGSSRAVRGPSTAQDVRRQKESSLVKAFWSRWPIAGRLKTVLPLAVAMVFGVLAGSGVSLSGFAQTEALEAGLPSMNRVVADPAVSVIDLRPGRREVVVEPSADPAGGAAQSPLGEGRWIVMSVANPSTKPQSRILVLQSPTLAGSGVFGAGVPGLRVNTAVAWSSGVTAHTLPWVETRTGIAAYEVDLNPDNPTTIALQVSERDAPYSIALWEPETYRRLDRLIAAAKGVIIGVLMSLIALAAGRWVLLGQQTDLTTTTFVGGGFAVVAASFGVQYGLITPDHAMAGGIRAAALALFASVGLYLLRHTLPLERLHRDLPRHVSTAALGAVGLAVLSLPGGPFAALAGVAGLITALFAVGVVALFTRMRHSRAIALTPGIGLVVFSALATTLVSLTTPGPYADLQAMMLTGALAGGVTLCAVSSLLPRPGRASETQTENAESDVGERIVSAPALAADNVVPIMALERELPEQEMPARSDLALEAAREGIWDFDVDTGRLTVSPIVEAMLGLRMGRLGHSLDDWCKRLHPDDVDMMTSVLEAQMSRGNQSFEFDFRMLHEDQAYRWVSLRGSALPGDNGQARRLVGTLTDVTARKNGEACKSDNGMQDPLTGLANRALLLDRLARLLEARHPEDPLPALLMIDLDGFKTINEGLGHADGDAVLVGVARRLEELVSSDDTVARVGGDEYAILLAYGIGEEGARSAGRVVSDVLGTPITVGDQEVYPSVTIGVASAEPSQFDALELLHDAEIALYRAKAKGYGEIVEFSVQMRRQGQDRVALESALRRAVERDQIGVVYQPIYDLRDSRLAGFEALMRWRHPERGWIAPADFIDLAEETGMIVEIGLRVLEIAVEQIRAWHARWPMDPPLYVNVNVSSRQLLSPDFASQVRDVVAHAGLAPRSLRLEITESLVMANPERADETLRVLRDEGIGLAIDDFGTGFSSFAHLHRFPFETLKIDRSFIAGVADNDQARAIVSAIVSLGHELGMEVVGEGTEREEDVKTLEAIGCDYVQGFALGAPVRPEAAKALLSEALGPGQSEGMWSYG